MLLHSGVSVLCFACIYPSLITMATASTATATAFAQSTEARPCAASDMIVSPEHCELLDGVQRISDQLWAESGPQIAGATGYRAVKLLSATNSHPEFPIFAPMLASVPSLASGQPTRLAVCMC